MIDPNLTSAEFDALVDYADFLIASSQPDEVIERDGDPFFERWYVARKADGPVENAYIHRFLRSDREEPHDHPWRNHSLVLKGSYVELTFDQQGNFTKRQLLAGQSAGRDATAIHSIEAVEPGTITFFTTGPKIREWGFWTSEGWIHWSRFRAWKEARNG